MPHVLGSDHDGLLLPRGKYQSVTILSARLTGNKDKIDFYFLNIYKVNFFRLSHISIERFLDKRFNELPTFLYHQVRYNIFSTCFMGNCTLYK